MYAPLPIDAKLLLVCCHDVLARLQHHQNRIPTRTEEWLTSRLAGKFPSFEDRPGRATAMRRSVAGADVASRLHNAGKIRLKLFGLH